GGDRDEGGRDGSPGHRPAPRDSGGGAGRGGTWILSSDTPPQPTPVGPDRHIAPGLPGVLRGPGVNPGLSGQGQARGPSSTPRNQPAERRPTAASIPVR